MALTKYKLGNYIELLDNRNNDLIYDADYVRGVNTSKTFMKTRVDLASRDLSKFQIVAPCNFVFNHRTSRNGSKLSIAYNDTGHDIICTEDYIVFCIKQSCNSLILAEWLYMFFNRPEFDRYVITNSWGSSTEFFNWEDMCDIDITLPPLHIQQKYVNIYNAMLANQRCYERGLDDLKLTIDAIIDQLKHTSEKVSVGELLEEVDYRNDSNKYTSAHGINITKQFMPSIASGDDLRKYKIVKKNQFAYSAMQTGRDECIRIALSKNDMPIIVSPAYSVLQKKSSLVIEDYIQMWFSRAESDRLGWFMSDASIRASLDLSRFYEIEIPLPSMSEQKSLVNIYSAYISRRNINAKLQAQIKSICPILIKGSLEEGSE